MRVMVPVIAVLLLTAFASARAADVLVLTSSEAVESEIARQVPLEPVESRTPATLSAGSIPGGSSRRSYRLLLARVNNLASATPDVIEALLGAHAPRHLVVLDTAMSVGDTLDPGDVAVARLVWDYRISSDGIEPMYSRQFRADGALLNACLTLGDGWRRPIGATKMASGAVAGGPWDPARGGILSPELLAANGRTIALLPAAAPVAEAVEALQAQGARVGTILIAGISTAAENPEDSGEGDAVAARHSVAFLLSLLTERWPANGR